MKTYAPSATNRCAVARPIPLLPPVMTATFPSSLLINSLLFASTTGSLRVRSPLLINGQTNKPRLNDWRRDSLFPPAFYEVSKNSVHFDRRLVCVVAIHRRSQFGTRRRNLRALFCHVRLRHCIAASTRDRGAFTKCQER